MGNIYYFPNSTLADYPIFNISSSSSSNWADQGTSRPFNATTVAGNFTGTGLPQDWYPFTLNTTASADFINITSISVLPSNPNLSSNLNCTAIANSSFTSMNFTGNWSKNGVLQAALAFNTSALPNGTNNVLSTISSSLLTSLDNWSCSAAAFNGTTYSALNTSANVTVREMPKINSLYLLPANPRISDNLLCYVNANSTTNATLNIIGDWFLNGANVTGLHFSTTAANNTTTLVSNLTYTNISEGQNWSCAVYANDTNGASTFNYSSNLTVLYNFHPDIIMSRLNGTATTNSATFSNFTAFNFTSAFGTLPTTYFIYATLTAVANSGSPTAQYQILVDGNLLDVATRTVGANGIGSVALSTSNFTLSTAGPHTVAFQHARTGSGTLATNNMTAIIVAMRDIDQNLTINNSHSTVSNTTTSTTWAKINSFNLTTDLNSSLVVMSEYVLNETGGATSGLVMYQTRITMANGTTQNCSTVYRWLSSGSTGSVGSFCAIFPDTKAGNQTIELWAQVTSGQNVNFSGQVHSFKYVGESTRNLNKTDLNGKTITTSNVQIANTTIKLFVNPAAKHDIEALVSISGNASTASNAQILVTLINLSDGSPVMTSLDARRRFSSAGQPGVIIKVASFENISPGEYAVVLNATTTAGTISILDGRIVAMGVDNTPATNYVFPPNAVEILSPLNVSYNRNRLLNISYTESYSHGLAITGYDVFLYNASTGALLRLLAINTTYLNFTVNVSAYNDQLIVGVRPYQSDGQWVQTNSSLFVVGPPSVNASVSRVASIVKFPATSTSDLPVSCMAPINQTGVIGIYNLTNNGSGISNILVRINATLPCFNYTISNTSTCSSGLNMTASNQSIYNDLANGASIYLWAFQQQSVCLGTDIPRFKFYIEAD